MLFALFLISLLAAVGLGVYFAGGLLAGRSRNVQGFTVPPSTPYVSLANPPASPPRVPRGTTPPPLPPQAVARAQSPAVRDEDLTDPDANARFSRR